MASREDKVPWEFPHIITSFQQKNFSIRCLHNRSITKRICSVLAPHSLICNNSQTTYVVP